MEDRGTPDSRQRDASIPASARAVSPDRDGRTALIVALITLAGVVFGALWTGYSTYRTNIVVSKNEFHASLVLRMLEADTENDCRDGLNFLLETGLLSGSETAATLRSYLDTDRPLPQVHPEGGVVVPRTPESSAYTDFTVYVCGPQWGSAVGNAVADPIVDTLRTAEETGQISKRPWNFYDEIPLAELEGRITIIVDLEHREASEAIRIQQLLQSAGLPSPVIVDNKGTDTPWYLSIVACPIG